MRQFVIVLFIFLCINGFSQNFRYYKPGQAFSSAENACLLIKNDAATLAKLHQLGQYSSFKAVKLSGFDKEFNPDSLLSLINRAMNVELIIFENCDLVYISNPIPPFNALNELRLLNCSFDESDLFVALKSSDLKTLSIQQPEKEIELDSIYLLKHLEKLQLSNTKYFSGATSGELLQVADGKTNTTIRIAYYGAFSDVSKDKAAFKDEMTHSQKPMHVPLDCVRQPIPGIDINDTAYYLNASSAGNFSYESGSMISIDRNAFTTTTGDNYTGNVQVFYREFRNPVEIMLSGIPMSNVVNGKTELFMSGGMYEINAFDTKGNPLKARTDTSIKINFALTDTAANFSFFSLNNNGSWTTRVDTVKTSRRVNKDSTTKAVKMYYEYMNSSSLPMADSTTYEARFLSNGYLYTYRKDNLTSLDDSSVFLEGNVKRKFKIRYVKRTKSKEIIFTVLPPSKSNYFAVPRYLRPLLYKRYVYAGSLSIEEFKKMFNRKLFCWDLRVHATGNTLHLTVKTDKAFVEIDGTPVSLRDDNTYIIQKKDGMNLARIVQRLTQHEAKAFDRRSRYVVHHSRFSPNRFNNLNRNSGSRSGQDAYKYCQQFQNLYEKGLSYSEWQRYLKKFPDDQYNNFQYNNTVGNALLKSGLGINNIDCYIHTGAMEPIYVQYTGEKQNGSDEYNSMLYKSINGSYLFRHDVDKNALSGYYFKKHQNYLVRFSENGYMQVTRPEDLSQSKAGSYINVPYRQQYEVKGLSSKQITHLIFE